jgi:Flp pilus assembly secretin CpaC
LAKGLGDSRLAVVSGRPASVNLIGGEFPIPTSDDSKAAVEFKEYGTRFDIQAITLGNHQVRLEVTTSVSTIDPVLEVEINGVRVPGLKVRRCKNVSELSFGQTTVWTGLVEHRVEAELRNGKLHEEVNEVQFMVVVTPELAPALDVPTASANRDVNRAIRK